MLTRCFGWFCRDRRTGAIVISQWPNRSLWLFGIMAVIASVTGGSRIGVVADIASRVCLAWWAGDELLRGVNPWRRCLGAAVLIGLGLRVLAG